MNKLELRKYFKNIKLNKDYLDDASKVIAEKVINSIKFKEAKNIFIYLSTPLEVNTENIIVKAFKDRKEVYVPKCLDGEKMILVKIETLDDLSTGMYGIKEPLNSDAFNGEIDLSIIPCLSCSHDGKRLGHGKGYYDRYLKSHSTYKMALCFSKMIYQDIPMEENDQYMDEVISES